MAVLLRMLPMTVLTTALLAAPEGNATELQKALDRLTKAEGVVGSAVGIGGNTEGLFYTLSKTIREHGSSTDFKSLIESKNPIERCMGLYCLANSDAADADDILRKHLDDSAWVSYLPIGCVLSEISVGEFSLELLLYRNPLQWREAFSSHVSEKKSMGVAIDALSRDAAFNTHETASELIEGVIERSGFELDIVSLRKSATHLEDFQLIKAVGRLPSLREARKFLQSCLENRESNAMARMAAASALTRHADESLYEYFDENTEYLNTLSSNFATRVKSDVLFGISHKANMKPIHAEKTWRGLKRIMDVMIHACSTAHPVAYDDLCNVRMGPTFAEAFHDDANDNDNDNDNDDDDVIDELERTVAETLISLARRQGSYSQPWNTYADVPFRMRDAVKNEPHFSFGFELRPEERKRLRAVLKSE